MTSRTGKSLPTAHQWLQRFTETPGALYELLRQLYQEVEAENEREDGVERRGRRPSPAGGTMQAIQDMVFPAYAEVPFTQAIRPYLKPSQNALALRAGINRGTFARILQGREPLDKAKLELIAKAARVSPAYFHEYRLIVLHEEFEKVMSPRTSIAAYKSIENGRTSVASRATRTNGGPPARSVANRATLSSSRD